MRAQKTPAVMLTKDKSPARSPKKSCRMNVAAAATLHHPAPKSSHSHHRRSKGLVGTWFIEPRSEAAKSRNRGTSRNRRVDLLVIYAEFRKRFLGTLHIEVSVARQPRQRCRDDRLGIHLEVPPQVLAVIAAPEPIRAQRYQPPAQPRRQLVGNHLHEVGGGDDRPFRSLKGRQDVRPFLRLGWMQAVPALNGQSVAPQFVVTGYAPDVGLHTILFSQKVLRAQGFIQNG